jgi:HEAT repeat protein
MLLVFALLAPSSHAQSEPTNIDRLIVALGHPLWTARRDAAESLARVTNSAAVTKAIPKLVATLSDSEPEVRRASVRALRAIGGDSEAAAIAIVDALDDGDWVVRREAAMSFRALRKSANVTVPAIRAALRGDSVPVRVAAALALADLAPHSLTALPELIQASRAKERELRAAAVHTRCPP